MAKESSYSFESTELSAYFQKTIIEILDTAKVEYKSEELSPLVLQTSIGINRTKLVILISPKWLGYKLNVDPEILGRTIGIQNDTDLYPLDFNIDHTKEIGEEILNVLKACINGKIYIGNKDNKYYLAVPMHDDTYKLIISKKYSSTEKMILYEELEKMDFIQEMKDL